MADYASTNTSGETDYIIQAFDITNTRLSFNILVDLTNYNDWNNWLLVDVNVNSVRELRFGPAGPSMYPSIDNLVINEIPLPAGIYFFLSGLVGLGLLRGRNA